MCRSSYDRVRPGYPDGLFVDLVACHCLNEGPRAGGGLRHPSGDELAGSARMLVTAIAGRGNGRTRSPTDAAFRNVEVETSTFEKWMTAADASCPRAASSWHWVDPSTGCSEATTCSGPEGGWHCSATLLSAGQENRRCTPRPPISTSGLPREPWLGSSATRGRCAWHHAGWGMVDDPAACSAQRSYAGTRRQWFDGDGFAICFVDVAVPESRATSGSPCSTPIPAASARGWATEHPPLSERPPCRTARWAVGSL